MEALGSLPNGSTTALDGETLAKVLWFCAFHNANASNATDSCAAPGDCVDNSNEEITKDDAAWILANAFLILTMQTGFGMLEAGTVSSKNIANIMVKNVVDVSIGGLAYWTLGYGLSFGTGGNFLVGWGDFFVTSTDVSGMGTYYARYIFQFSFATAATTIVSGAVAERIKLEAYMVYSCLNVFVYCLPARWAWSPEGWLGALGFYDFAGAAIVHMNGGASALVAAVMLGPRHARFEAPEEYGMSSPVTALTGTFMLWWAWLAFNCGSTFGIRGSLWKTATKVAVNTINGSIGGSLVGLAASVAMTWNKGRYFDIPTIICSVLGGLVGITAGCSVFTPGESIVVGVIGAIIAVALVPLMEHFKIDDPVGAVPVHFGAAAWSTLAVGIFGNGEFAENRLMEKGLLHGGSLYMVGVQLLGCVVVSAWAMASTWLCFFVIDRIIGIRMGILEEAAGADWVEHHVKSHSFADKLEKAIEKIQKRGMDREPDGQLLVQVLVDMMKMPEAQGTAGGVVSGFGGTGGDSHFVPSVATVTGNHRRSIPNVHQHSSQPWSFQTATTPCETDEGRAQTASAMYAEFAERETAAVSRSSSAPLEPDE